MNWQKLNATSSVTFADMFIISAYIMFVNDLFKVVFTTGFILSVTIIKVLFSNV